MTKRPLFTWPRFAIACLLLLVVGDYGCGYYERASAVETVRTWARLAPLPDHRQLLVEETGSMFTRGFRVVFLARREKVAEWLANSPGTQDVKTVLVPNQLGVADGEPAKRYSIKPGGGAMMAELITVEVDDAFTLVYIRTYWS